MRELKALFENNEKWAEGYLAQDPNYFKRMAKDQRPSYLWIGCSDSRIPANDVLGLEPGHLFVHRNIANLFLHTDFNCLSVLQYAVDYLAIEHVIVCGHYGCGGVGAAMENKQFGLVDNWLRNIRDVYSLFEDELNQIDDKTLRNNRLVELNVIQQAMHICQTTIAHNAWARKQPLCVHGWVYDIACGRLRDLDCCVAGLDQVEKIYQTMRTSPEVQARNLIKIGSGLTF